MPSNLTADLSSILLLEDDPVMREVLTELLSDEGYVVHVAARGEEAIERVGTMTVDLLIFDIRMEGIDGLEALARMRKSGLNIPSLAITGFADDEAPVRAMRLGVGDYLRKPFRPELLLESVARLLDDYRQREKLRKSLENLRRLTRWAAEVLPGKPQPPPHSYRFARLAGEIGEAAGLLPVAADCLELSTLVMAVDPLSRSSEDCPEVVRCWATSLEERYDGSGPKGLRANDIPLEARVVVLAHAASTQSDVDLAVLLQRKFPGRFDPFLLEALARLSGENRAAGSGRLSLARALMAGGDREEVRHTLERLVQDAHSGEAVEAGLALAHLMQGNPPAVLSAVQKTLSRAQQVGPAMYAKSLYQASLLMMREDPARGQEMLASAGPRLEALGLQAEAAMSRLLSGPLDGDLVEFVLRPEHEPELATAVDLLLPRLVEAAASPAAEKILRRLSLRYPEVARRLQMPAAAGTQLQEAEPAPSLRICTFGGLQVFWAGQPIGEEQWRGPLAKNLFSFLASQERPVLEDLIFEQFWPEGHDTSKSRLATSLSSIRKTINQATDFPGDPVLRTRNRYQLNPRLQAWNDVQVFQAAHDLAQEACRQGKPASAVPHWSKMASVYIAPYLEGCYMDWALRLREKLDSMLVEALMQLAEHSQAPAPDQALEYAQRIIHMDPLQQRAYQQAMQAFLKLGQPENAVRCFQRCKGLLDRELKVEPSIELLTLYHRAKLALP